MDARVTGVVVAVEDSSYIARDGSKVAEQSVYLAPNNPKFGPDRVSVPAGYAPKVGETFDYMCRFAAYPTKGGKAFLSVRLVVESKAA